MFTRKYLFGYEKLYKKKRKKIEKQPKSQKESIDFK